ncbi:hypothetical protein TI04_13500 [Achromatium sp. WMS2]|nr:hypothetical protein TI04_13500 [Achromatium sp. WMS2]
MKRCGAGVGYGLAFVDSECEAASVVGEDGGVGAGEAVGGGEEDAAFDAVVLVGDKSAPEGGGGYDGEGEGVVVG